MNTNEHLERAAERAMGLPNGFTPRAKRIHLNDLHAKGKCIGCGVFVDAIRARAGCWLCVACRDSSAPKRLLRAAKVERPPEPPKPRAASADQAVEKQTPASMFWLPKSDRLRVGLLHEKGLCMTCEQPLAGAALAAGFWKCEACKAQTKVKAQAAHRKRLAAARKKRRALRMPAAIK